MSPRALPLALRVGAVALAMWMAHVRAVFTSDDAWISFRYAWNLVHGFGLRYNPGGEPVEGYSNLLWTLWSALGIGLHVPIERWVYVSGLGAAGLITFLAGSTAWKLTGSRVAEAGALLFAAASAIVGECATTGLETPLLTLLVAVSLRLSAEGTWRGLVLGASAGGLAAITHVEGPVFLLVPLVAALSGPRLTVRQWGLLGVAALGPLAAQECLRLAYYGAWLPLTFEVKFSGQRGVRLVNGFRMLAGAAVLGFPLLALAALGAARFRALSPLLLAPVAGVMLFVMVVNGDEIGGLRFVAAAVPAVAVLAGLGVLALSRVPRFGWALAAVLALGAAGWDLGTRSIRIARVETAGPDQPADSWSAALTPPWSAAQHVDPLTAITPIGRMAAPSSEPDWFLLYLIETVPPGGSFTYADVGVAGYALNGADLWDLRGLNWPATARMNSSSRSGSGEGSTSTPEAVALVREFARRAPDVVVALCQGDHLVGRSESVIGQSVAFTANYEFVKQGPYAAVSRETVCIFRLRGGRTASREDVERRKAWIRKAMPGVVWPEGS